MRIKELRESQNLQLEDFSVMVGITPSYISAIERGKRRGSLTVAKRIVDVLSVLTGQNLTIDDVYFDKSKSKKKQNEEVERYVRSKRNLPG